jgi:putative FmdB family regulatory protein
MPIYEFYCCDCHRVFKFLARRQGIDRRPACPRCERPELEKQVSLFAVSRGRKEVDAGEDGEPELDLDEDKMERAMELLEREASDLDEDDPRQAAHLMRRLYDSTGLRLGPAMEEAIQRMESGEDPDAIEEQMGDALEAEDPFLGAGVKGIRGLRRRLLPPEVDDKLYDL